VASEAAKQNITKLTVKETPWLNAILMPKRIGVLSEVVYHLDGPFGFQELTQAQLKGTLTQFQNVNCKSFPMQRSYLQQANPPMVHSTILTLLEKPAAFGKVCTLAINGHNLFGSQMLQDSAKLLFR